ncbi:hypothetical protein [uncultured Bradyrhizobium sp.]|uniref:hypothetical protein n=1 Tax=uncultured Bradyrhizobium sp. TaxID=199684 RepID=UPI00261740A9|nr:hypothetical protein [uncultured Bradyrhizobium sp.]
MTSTPSTKQARQRRIVEVLEQHLVHSQAELAELFSETHGSAPAPGTRRRLHS